MSDARIHRHAALRFWLYWHTSDEMKRYRHAGGESGVSAYDTGPRSITIQFQDGGIYRYTYAKPGARHVETMKELAAEGKGLATYINQHIRGDYAARLN